MAIEETGSYIGDFSTTASANKPTDNPGKRADGAGEIRQLKKILFDTLPEADGPINVSDTEFNYLAGVTSAIQSQINNVNSSLLSLGTASAEDVGTSSGDVVQLGASGLPAVGASLLTNLPGINQIQVGTHTTTETTTSVSYVDTSLTVSITPESASSTILLICSTSGRVSGSGSGTVSGAHGIRESTTTIAERISSYTTDYPSSNGMTFPVCIIATTASTGTSIRTFKLSHFAGTSDTVHSSYNNSNSYIIALEIGG